MSVREIRLNKEQFRQFNEYDQFQLFCDDEGFPEYDNYDEEVEKLFQKYDYIVVTENDYIYGVKNNKRDELSTQATESYGIAMELMEN